MNKLKNNVIANYFGHIYGIFIGIFMLPFYLSYLGAESYGLVGFFTMLTSIMMMVEMGLSSALAREIAKFKDKDNGLYNIKKLVVSTEFLFLLISAISIVIIFFNTSWLVTSWLNVNELSIEVVEHCIYMMGIIIGLRYFIGLYRATLIGFEYQVWLNIYKSIMMTLKFIGGFLLIKYISNDIEIFFIYQVLLAIIEVLVLKYKSSTFYATVESVQASINTVKQIVPMSLSIAYTSSVWIVFTQLDKLLLSHYIPLEEYGYFALVVVVSNAIMQLSGPLSQAFLPPMVSFLSNNKYNEMIKLYHDGTKFVSILIISIGTIVSYFSYELLYSWTGDIEASIWASDILRWYTLGNVILAISAFQYYLQYVYGDLSYHVKFNTIFPLIVLPIMFLSVSNYQAIGAAYAWFSIQLVTFFIWPPFIHKKFIEGEHKKWLFEDIAPSVLFSLVFIFLVDMIDINFGILSRGVIFALLILLGFILLLGNILMYKNIRELLINKFLKGKENVL